MRPFKQSVFASLAVLILAASASWTCRVCTAQLVGDDLDFPYQALVLRDDAPIHSGPGQVHYPTQRLKQGDAVQVYRHDPGGWCAIRPVTGSFSLVPESTLELVDEGVGKVTQDGTQAWVGTELGAVDKPLWQVKLRKDELVEVLGQISWPNPEGHSNIWYQIASPAGEFRWIQMSDIQLPVSIALGAGDQALANQAQTVRSLNEIRERSPALDPRNPSLTTHAISNGSSNRNNHEGLQTAYEDPSASSGFSTDPKSNSINDGWRQATRPIINSSISAGRDSVFSSSTGFDEGLSGPSFNSRNSMQTEFENRQNLGFDSERIRVANADVEALNLAGELNTARGRWNAQRGTALVRISDLELRLTGEMLKQNPSQWRLGELESTADTIMRNSIDHRERALAQKFLSKISNCKTIQSGYLAEMGSEPIRSASGQTLPIGTGVDREIELDTTYDAHGWLNKMVRNGGSSESTFVLQDASGTVTHHVSPIPGLNLHRYLKAQIGIIGQRGYHSQLKLNHVTAHRVIVLKKHR